MSNGKVTRGEKRNCVTLEDNTVSMSQKKNNARESDGKEATDDEVEEFCAILRRLKGAAKYIKRGTGSHRRLDEEIMQQVNDVVKWGGSRGYDVKNLDLNVTPPPE